MKRLDVVIVGAGAAGIACGRRLLSKGKCNFIKKEKTGLAKQQKLEYNLVRRRANVPGLTFWERAQK